ARTKDAHRVAPDERDESLAEKISDQGGVHCASKAEVDAEDPEEFPKAQRGDRQLDVVEGNDQEQPAGGEIADLRQCLLQFELAGHVPDKSDRQRKLCDKNGFTRFHSTPVALSTLRPRGN